MKYHTNGKVVHQAFRNVPFGKAIWLHTNLTVAPVIKVGREAVKLGNGTETAVANQSTLYVRVPDQQLRPPH